MAAELYYNLNDRDSHKVIINQTKLNQSNQSIHVVENVAFQNIKTQFERPIKPRKGNKAKPNQSNLKQSKEDQVELKCLSGCQSVSLFVILWDTEVLTQLKITKFSCVTNILISFQGMFKCQLFSLETI